jgi:hypothetical protein
MIAVYIKNSTEEEVYVNDFTAIFMAEKGNDSKVGIVIYQEKNNYTTFVISREIFDKEFTKK